MKCLASRSRWAFSSSSSRVISNEYKSRLARIRFPSGSIISERVSGEIEVAFPGEHRLATSQEKPADTEELSAA